jgi:hypothetical protein
MSLTIRRLPRQEIAIDPENLNIRVSAYAVGPYGQALPIKVRISIQAPRELRVLREELLEKDRKEPT